MTKFPSKTIGDWTWKGMGYRLNGDGFGIFKNEVTGQRAKVGAIEAGWCPERETYKQACFRAMQKRMDEALI